MSDEQNQKPEPDAKELSESELKDVSGGITKVIDKSSPTFQNGVSNTHILTPPAK